MRHSSLQSIRSRVERLADQYEPKEPEVLLIHWKNPFDNCPECGCDLDAHARGQVLAKVQRDGDKRQIFFYWWPNMLDKCPDCGGPLPTGSKWGCLQSADSSARL